jgi:uncharacterized membrane protein
VPDDDQGFDSRATDRLTLFSDAVVAIAITLLAIDLPVPVGDTTAALLSSVRGNSGHYVAFLISFVVIAAAWSGHHDIFGYTRRIDDRLRQLNMIWLLMMVLTPFATRLLTTQGNETTTAHALRFGFYALVQAVESGILVIMLRYMTTRGLSRGLPGSTVTEMTRQSYALVAGFALSIPVLFATDWGWLLWFVVPFAFAANRGLKSRRQRTAAADLSSSEEGTGSPPRRPPSLPSG